MRNEHSFRVDVILVSYKNDHRHSHSGEEKKKKNKKLDQNLPGLGD